MFAIQDSQGRTITKRATADEAERAALWLVSSNPPYLIVVSAEGEVVGRATFEPEGH